MWKYSRDKVARKVMINKIQNGGMNMIDFKLFCSSMKAIWTYRLYTSNKETWSIIPNIYFKNCDIKTLMCMNFETEKQLPLNLPQFYKEAIVAWHQCGGGKKAPQNALDIRQELIWGNNFIQSKGKTLFFANWKKSNINFIDDLLTKDGNFKSGEEICSKLQQTSNWLIEYKTILKSIPRIWKEKLKTPNIFTKVKKDLKPFLNYNNKLVFDLPVKAKGYYQILIKNTAQKTYNEKYWGNIFIDRPLWEDIWNKRVKCQNVKKLADFHFKLLHRILPSQENLYKWKLSNSNLCRFGCSSIETYDHMFITCPRLSNMLSKVETLLRTQGIDLKITYKILITGHKTEYNSYKDVNIFFSHLFFSIYKYWLHNDSSKNIMHWIQSELRLWKNIYEETNKNIKILNNIIDKW